MNAKHKPAGPDRPRWLDPPTPTPEETAHTDRIIWWVFFVAMSSILTVVFVVVFHYLTDLPVILAPVVGVGISANGMLLLVFRGGARGEATQVREPCHEESALSCSACGFDGGAGHFLKHGKKMLLALVCVLGFGIWSLVTRASEPGGLQSAEFFWTSATLIFGLLFSVAVVFSKNMKDENDGMTAFGAVMALLIFGALPLGMVLVLLFAYPSDMVTEGCGMQCP